MQSGGDDPRLVAAIGGALASLGWVVVPRADDQIGAGRVFARVIAHTIPDGSVDQAWQGSKNVRTIVVGPRWAAHALATALARGAVAVVDSEQPFLDLLIQIDGALKLSAPVQRSYALETLRERARMTAALSRLSPRQQVVLAGLVEGMTAAEIAASRHVSIATVRTHIHDILVRLDVNSQLAAVAAAHRYASVGPVRDAVRQIHQI